MALFSKARGILKQSLTNHINKEISVSTPSIYQVLRCMSSKLFFGGISFNMDETSLREECSKYGEVIEARIIVDRETGNSRGFGFVTFANAEDASSAIQALDQKELYGRTIRVNYANDRTRGYTGGGGNYGGGNYGGGNYGGGNYGGGGYEGGNYGGGGNYSSGGRYGGGSYGGGGGGGDYGRGNYGGGDYGGRSTGGYVAPTPASDNYASGGIDNSYNSAGNYTPGGVGGGSTESSFGGGVQYPTGNVYGSGNQGGFGVAPGDNYIPDPSTGPGAGNQYGGGGGVQFGDVADVPPYNPEANFQDENDPQDDYLDKRA